MVLVARLGASNLQKPLRVVVIVFNPVALMALLLVAVLLNPVLPQVVVVLALLLPQLHLVAVVPLPRLEASNPKRRLHLLAEAANLAGLRLLKPFLSWETLLEIVQHATPMACAMSTFLLHSTTLTNW